MFKKSVSIQLIEPVVYIRGTTDHTVQYNNIIRGYVVLQSTGTTAIQAVKLNLIGIAKTIWPEGIGADGNQTCDKKRFINQCIDIDLPHNNVTNRHYTAYSGYNRLPFEMFIPSNIPESIDCDLGFVEYKLVATVYKIRRFPFSSQLVTDMPIQLIRLPIDCTISGDGPAESVSISRALSNFGDYAITIEKQVVTPGTTLPVSLRILSNVKNARIEGVVVKIHERCTIRAPDKGVTRIINHKITLRRTDQISAKLGINLDDLGGGVAWEDRIFYEIPDDRKMRLHASTTYRDISVRHWIQVLVRLSVPNTNSEELETQPRVFKEVMLDSKLCVLRAGALTEDLVTLPQYSEKIQGNDMSIAWGDLPEYSPESARAQKPTNTANAFLDLASPLHLSKRIGYMMKRNRVEQEKLSRAQSSGDMPRASTSSRFRFSCKPHSLSATEVLPFANPRYSDSIVHRLQSMDLL
ncbi:hypothetical protein NQZ79_g3996 [Umbelopsis isabellina]|nr:hypothetical protein NQZ79_g3996 [Umbelopsis isabellina]